MYINLHKNSINLSLIFIIILTLTPFSIHAQQLNLYEKPDIIYNNFSKKKVSFRLNGNIYNAKAIRKVLLDSSVSSKIMLKSIKQRKIGLSFFLGSIIPTFGGLNIMINSSSLEEPKRQRKGFVMFTTGLILQVTSAIIIGKSKKNFKKSFDLFNSSNTLKQPISIRETINENKDTLNIKYKIINSNTEATSYFINGKLVNLKEIDRILLAQKKLNLFVTPIIEAKKRQKKLTYVCLSAGALSVATALHDRNSGTPKISQASIVSLSFLGISLSVKFGKAIHINHLRSNAIKVYNEEPPIPFNRQHKKIIKNQTQLVLASGDYGYGLLLKF